MTKFRLLLSAMVLLASTPAAGKEFASHKEYTSSKPYYNCLGLIESNPYMTENVCDLIKEGIEIKKKEVGVMVGLCRKAETTYYSGDRPIYAVKNGRVYSDNGLVYECRSGKIHTLDHSPFE